MARPLKHLRDLSDHHRPKTLCGGFLEERQEAKGVRECDCESCLKWLKFCVNNSRGFRSDHVKD